MRTQRWIKKSSYWLGALMLVTAGCRFGLVDRSLSVSVKIERVEPSLGSIYGGENITLIGRNFEPGATVYIDGVQTKTERLSQTVLSISTPPHAAGYVEMVVELTDGRADACLDCYQYIEPEVRVDSVTPQTGPVQGGTEIIISGVNFRADLKVFFGDAQAEVVSTSRSQISARAPQHSFGPVAVTIRTENLDIAATADEQFRYYLPAHRFIERVELNAGAVEDILPADLNNDGFEDIILFGPQNSQGEPLELVRVLLNKGDGRFHPPVDSAMAITATSEPVLCDWDGDSHRDLIVSSYTGTIYTMLYDGGGQFAAAQPLPGGPTDVVGLRSVQCGDFDGDQTTDLAALRHPCSTGECPMLSIYFGDGTGVVGEPLEIIPDLEFRGAWTTADFDEDSSDDIALIMVKGTFQNRATTVQLYRHLGSGTPTRTDWSLENLDGHIHLAPMTGDFNCDSHVDLLVPGQDVLFFSGDGQGGLTLSPTTFPGTEDTYTRTRRSQQNKHLFPISRSIAPPVGYMDLSLAGCSWDDSTGAPHVPVEQRFWLYGSHHTADLGEIIAAATLNANGDQAPEIVVAHRQGVDLVFSGAKGPEGGVPWWDHIEVCQTVFADVDNDGIDDVIDRHLDDYNLDYQGPVATVHYSSNLASTRPQQVFLNLPEHLSAFWPHTSLVSDINDDGFVDLVIGLESPDDFALAVIPSTGELDFAEPIFTSGPVLLPYEDELCWSETFGSQSEPILQPYFCDFDGDSQKDIVQLSPSQWRYSPGDGTGGFGAPVELTAPPIAGSSEQVEGTVLLADTNGDGVCEIIFRRGALAAVAGLTAEGQLTVLAEPLTLPDATRAWTEMGRVADLNADGRADLVVVAGDEENKDIYVYLGVATGGFSPPILVAEAAGRVDQLLVGDVDGDGLDDIVAPAPVHGYWATPLELHIITGRGGGTFVQHPPSLLNAPGTLFTADLNGDSLIDFYSCPLYRGQLSMAENVGMVLLNASP